MISFKAGTTNETSLRLDVSSLEVAGALSCPLDAPPPPPPPTPPPPCPHPWCESTQIHHHQCIPCFCLLCCRDRSTQRRMFSVLICFDLRFLLRSFLVTQARVSASRLGVSAAGPGHPSGPPAQVDQGQHQVRVQAAEILACCVRACVLLPALPVVRATHHSLLPAHSTSRLRPVLLAVPQVRPGLRGNFQRRRQASCDGCAPGGQGRAATGGAGAAGDWAAVLHQRARAGVRGGDAQRQRPPPRRRLCAPGQPLIPVKPSSSLAAFCVRQQLLCYFCTTCCVFQPHPNAAFHVAHVATLPHSPLT